jgi:protein TonB
MLHTGMALVELNAFKRPLSGKIVPKALTVNIVVPQPIKKHSVDKNPSIVVKKSVVKKRITKKVKPLQKIKPKVNRKKSVQPKRSKMKKKQPKKNEILADLVPIAFPPDKKRRDDFFDEDDFVPDRVDIPLAIPNTHTMPHKEKKEDVSASLSAIPVTYAHPIYKRNISPPYPLLARKRGYQGTVLLEVLVSTDGKAASVRVSESSGHSILDRAAIKGVRDWLFYPAKRGDEVLEMWVKIPIRFTLN